MREFAGYVRSLDNLIATITKKPLNAENMSSIELVLDGQPLDELRRLVPREKLRHEGAFFSGSRLSSLALEPIWDTIDHNSVILDPACGAGDLLISCARRLPKKHDLASTLHNWGNQIIGRELHDEFIHTTKARLTLTAILEGVPAGEFSQDQVIETFPNILKRSGLSDKKAIGSATHIVLNPPFTMIDAPKECTWTSGKVNAAAIFLEECISNSKPGTRIVAILPDVLRSGSRYWKWREMISSQTRQFRLELFGRFDKWTDVDVFILDIEVTKNPVTKGAFFDLQCSPDNQDFIGARFDIHVGPVVEYRDPHCGPWYRYIKPRTLATWKVIRDIPNKRRFLGRVFFPPFMVVRRTSKEGDHHRAVGTIVAGEGPVAVENHLIILQPKDRSLRSCEELLGILERPETTVWLNKRIRCRHLTKSALSQIPWWSTSG